MMTANSRRWQPRTPALIASMALCATLVKAPAWAARPMITDDARIVDEHACQLESWWRKQGEHSELWALPGCNIVVFTSFAEDEMLRATLQAGAIGYLLKDAARHDLVSAVRAVAAGQPWLHETMQRQLVELLRRPPPPDPFAALTPRERSVLALIGEGLSNRRIAQRLGLTEGTVKGYVSAVLEKLGLPDRTQAALLWNRKPR